MPTKKTNITSKENWFDKPLNRYVTISGIVASVFLAGYKVGDYKKDVEQQLILIKQSQECNEKLQQERERCMEFRRENEDKTLDNLAKTVEELTKLKNGK